MAAMAAVRSQADRIEMHVRPAANPAGARRR
jgi:hypothetical protein